MVTAAPAPAQQETSLANMALIWAYGSYASPVICEFDGKPVRGIRRLSISPGPSHARTPVARIRFVDLDADKASRCFTDLDGEAPNVIGSVQIRLLGKWRPDTAQRDFREQLRRKRGFEYEVASGGLRLQTLPQARADARGVDFGGGRVSLRTLTPSGDYARLLAPFESPRKLLLEISAKDGTKLAFPLYLSDPH